MKYMKTGFVLRLGSIFIDCGLFFQVFSTDINGLNTQEILNVSVEAPENLAVDWINNKLYLVETKVNRIDMVNLDGSQRITLITENLGRPRGIAVDPTVG